AIVPRPDPTSFIQPSTTILVPDQKEEEDLVRKFEELSINLQKNMDERLNQIVTAVAGGSRQPTLPPPRSRWSDQYQPTSYRSHANVTQDAYPQAGYPSNYSRGYYSNQLGYGRQSPDINCFYCGKQGHPLHRCPEYRDDQFWAIVH